MSHFSRHAAFQIQQRSLGREQRPLLVIDHCLAQADALVETAVAKVFTNPATYYPGVRARVPLVYQEFILGELGPLIREVFQPASGQVRFTSCHFSLVTTPRDKLGALQRIPHADSLANGELAFVHYLFRRDLGGTAFFRHRQSGFEYVDHARFGDYNRMVTAELAGPDSPPADYIGGDTPLFEEIARQEGVFNRLVMYRRTSLHSGLIHPSFHPTADPRTGRLSITGFLA